MVPAGFIPVQDMGYFLVVVQLPDAAAFDRTDAVIRKVDEIARNTEGVAHTFSIVGYSTVLGANQSNVGAAFIIPAIFCASPAWYFSYCALVTEKSPSM
jgi:multidrug efflux pump